MRRWRDGSAGKMSGRRKLRALTVRRVGAFTSIQRIAQDADVVFASIKLA